LDHYFDDVNEDLFVLKEEREWLEGKRKQITNAVQLVKQSGKDDGGTHIHMHTL